MVYLVMQYYVINYFGIDTPCFNPLCTHFNDYSPLHIHLHTHARSLIHVLYLLIISNIRNCFTLDLILPSAVQFLNAHDVRSITLTPQSEHIFPKNSSRVY